jgi:hypothetical protein
MRFRSFGCLTAALFVLGVPATAAADGGTSIAAATPVVFGMPQTGDVRNGFKADVQCPTLRSWWALNVTAGDEVTVSWQSDRALGFVFPVGTTDANLREPAFAPSGMQAEPVDPKRQDSGFRATFTITAEATGAMPLQFAMSTDCGSNRSSGAYGFTATVRPASPPASAEFRATWKAADEAVARWDLKRARTLITPLLGANATLPQVQRLWFDLSAARILSLVGETAKAREYARDAESISPPSRDAGSFAIPESFEGFPAPIGRAPAQERCLLSSGDELQAPLNVATALDRRPSWVEFTGHYRPRKAGGAISAYAGGDVPSAGRGRYLCHALFVTFSGGATGVQSGTSRHTIVIPSTEPVIAKRVLKRGARITAQAFALKSSDRVIATWRRYAKGARKPNRTLRTTLRAKNETVLVRAPSAPGSWDLQLGVGSARDFSTGVTRVTIR